MAVNEDQGNAIVPGSEDNSLLQAINDSGGSGAVPDLNLPTNFEPDAPNPPPPPEIPQNNPPPGGDDSTTHEPDDATNSNVGNVPIIKFDPNFGTPQPNNPIPSPPPPLSPPFIPTGPFD